MRSAEQIVAVHRSLPEEGIALHGTSRARAKRILDVGLTPSGPELEELEIKHGKTFYVVQPPNCDDWETTYQNQLTSIRRAAKYAVKATIYPGYGNSEEDNNEPVLIVFRPLKKFAQGGYDPFNYPFDDTEENPIPKDRIIGVIPLDIKSPNFRSTAHNEIVHLLIKKRIISFARSRQSQKA